MQSVVSDLAKQISHLAMAQADSGVQHIQPPSWILHFVQNTTPSHVILLFGYNLMKALCNQVYLYIKNHTKFISAILISVDPASNGGS